MTAVFTVCSILAAGAVLRVAGGVFYPALVTTSSVVAGLVSVAGALLAWAALYWRRLPWLKRGHEPGTGLTVVIQRFQSGVINDYITWLVLGLAVLGGVLTLITTS